jgi:hypothetical protein
MIRNSDLREILLQVDTKLERLDVAIITRYPDSERAADNYEALRRAVIANGSAANRHAHDLIALATSIDEGASPETVRLKVRDLLGVLEVTEVSPQAAFDIPPVHLSEFFDVVGDQAHPRSAWVRAQDGQVQVLRRGFLSEPPTYARESGERESSSVSESTSEVPPPRDDQSQTSPANDGTSDPAETPHPDASPDRPTDATEETPA